MIDMVSRAQDVRVLEKMGHTEGYPRVNYL
jgi:hypothetical protein